VYQLTLEEDQSGQNVVCH